MASSPRLAGPKPSVWRRSPPCAGFLRQPGRGTASVAFILTLGHAAIAGAPGPLPPPAPPRPAAVGVLNDIRVWSTGDITRVALETSGEVQFQHARAFNPDRVYIDLVETRPDPSRGRYFTIPVEDGLIRQIRVGLNQDTTTRVVLDLTAKVDYTISQLANPYRVMLEVRHAGAVREEFPPVVSRVQPPPPVASKARPFTPPPPQPRLAPSFVLEPAPKVRVATRSRRTASPKFPIATAAPPPRAPAPRPPESPPAPPVQTAAANVTAVPPEPEPALEPRAAQRNRNGNRSLTRVLGLKLNRVVLDPGHGGYDHGSTGPGGVVEKHLVLDVAQRLGRLIEEGLGAEVVFTRDADLFVSLEDRARLANEREADLFLSIHANSSPYRSVSGVETYYLSFTTSKEDLEVAARENASSQRTMHELSDLVRQITLNDKAEESRDFAARVQAASHALAAQNSPRLRNRGVKKAPFVVLIGARMPSILTEIGFVSNAREEALLKRSDYREKIAAALYEGIYQYAETLSRFSVATGK